ncbi:hypothetical protein CPC16_004688, partial [Podila verticillata]
MLTVLHTLANSAGLFKSPEAAPAPSSSAQFKKAVQNLALIRKVILTENLKESQEQAALKHLDHLLDLFTVTSLASLDTPQLQEIASALYALTSASKDLKEILSSIRTTTSTTKITKTTKTIITSGEIRDDDNISVSSDEGPSSAATVVEDQDQFSLSIRSNLSLGIQGELDLYQLTSGNLAVEHVAYALSDLVFVYPSSSSHSYLGHASEQWSKAGLSNATGSSLAPQVLKMSTRSNAASAIHGAITSPASKGSAISTFASSGAIVNMVPNLYQIAQSGTPAVFHVAAESVDADLNILRGDYSDVLVARETGLVYLTSNSVQEAYDVAILAHAIAAGTQQSVIHILDGVQISQQVETIKTVRDQDVAAFIKSEARAPAASQDEDALANSIEKIFERASALLGRQYKAFEYSGPKDAETVAVVFGPAASSAQHLGDKVGVLNVRLYRPWSFSHFLKAVPSSVKNVVVVEPYGHHGASLTQGWLKALVQQAASSKKVDFAAVVASEEAQDDVSQVIFWETAGSASVSAHVAKHLQSALGHRVQHSSN